MNIITIKKRRGGYTILHYLMNKELKELQIFFNEQAINPKVNVEIEKELWWPNHIFKNEQEKNTK